MLYIMRHGQTDWNLAHKLQGRTDIPLNETGRQMAEEASQKYRDMKIDICYSSPLRRAYDTAKCMVKGRNIPIITDERLREMSFGGFEGEENVFGKPGHPMYTLFKNPSQYRACNDAESFDELFTRTGEFIREAVIPEIEKEKYVLIVGHGAMNLSIINRVYRVPLENYWERLPGNCELLELPLDKVYAAFRNLK